MTNSEKLEFANKIAIILQMIANPTRLLILCYLLEGEKNVSEILEKIEISQSALSQHIALLRENGIVISERRGQFIFYSLKNEVVRSILLNLQKICL